VQSQPIPALHTHYAPPQTTDQTLRVQIRRDHRRPSFHAPTRASRRICLFANALHALPRAAMVIHALPRAGTVFPRAVTHRQHLPRAPTRFGTISRGFRVPRAYWCVSCTRFLQPQALRVHHTRQAFFPGHALTGAWDARALAAIILWRVFYTRQRSHHYPAATCLSESRHVSPSCATCQASKKKKKLIRIQYFRPDPTG
jgi:hypothetical protein